MTFTLNDNGALGQKYYFISFFVNFLKINIITHIIRLKLDEVLLNLLCSQHPDKKQTAPQGAHFMLPSGHSKLAGKHMYR